MRAPIRALSCLYRSSECPDDVWELASVEVKVLHRRVLARPNNRYVEAHCETSLEIHATAHLIGFACEIGHQEARPTNLSNNLVVHFVQVVMLLVYAPWFVSRVRKSLCICRSRTARRLLD
jgi:hypothetical protein